MKIRNGSLISLILLSAAALNANPQPSGSAISILSAPVTISQPGTYRLANDITGDITITATNVVIDMSDRELTGVFNVSGDDVIIKDGKVKPAVPADNTEAAIAAITIAGLVQNAQILNLLIECADSTGLDISGRAAIENNGEKTFIIGCCIKSGASANSSSDTNGSAGGTGIISTGDKLQVLECSIMSGDGGNAGNPAISGSGFAGGAAGGGITIAGNLGCVLNTKIYTGNGGNGTNFKLDQDANGGAGGVAGDAIVITGDENQIKTCIIKTGFGGNGGNGGANLAVPGDGGRGGYGVFVNTGECNCVLRVKIGTGNGGTGGTAGAANGSSAGAHGVFVSTSIGTEIRHCIVVKTGSSGVGSDGVQINAASTHTEVRLCTFSNIGSGSVGRAVTDLNVATMSSAGASAIFSNFAYAIANLFDRYTIHNIATQGVDSTVSTNTLDNVFFA